MLTPSSSSDLGTGVTGGSSLASSSSASNSVGVGDPPRVDTGVDRARDLLDELLPVAAEPRCRFFGLSTKGVDLGGGVGALRECSFCYWYGSGDVPCLCAYFQ
jgi:hypothetical protein